MLNDASAEDRGVRQVSEDDAQWFVQQVIFALERRDIYRFAHSMDAIRAVIAEWSGILGIDQTWGKTEPPADILDKIVFPELQRRLEQASQNAQNSSLNALLSLPESELGKRLHELLQKVPKP
jgi:hypothetical protein